MPRGYQLLTWASVVLAASGALLPGVSGAKSLQFIQCGDRPSPGSDERIATFEKANPGVTIDLQVVGWLQCEQKITTLAAAGNPPAVAYVGSRTLPQLYENDLIVPVTLSVEDQSLYYPAVIDSVTYDGRVLGLPIAMSTEALYYSKALFRQAGLDPDKPPSTWQDLYEDAAAIKARTGIAGYGMPAKSFNTTVAVFMLWVYSNGGSVLTENKINMDSPNNVQVLEWYKKMEPVSEPGPSAYGREDMLPMFNDGKIAMFMSGPWERRRMATGMEYGIAPLPIGPMGRPGNLVVTDSLAVFKGSGVEDAAERFAKYLTNPQNQHAYELAFGLTPMRQGAEVSKLVADTPSWRPFVEGVQVAGPEPKFVDYVGFQKSIYDAIQSVLLGQTSPRQAVKTANSQLEAIMK